jgi:hypothetical protein
MNNNYNKLPIYRANIGKIIEISGNQGYLLLRDRETKEIIRVPYNNHVGLMAILETYYGYVRDHEGTVDNHRGKHLNKSIYWAYKSKEQRELGWVFPFTVAPLKIKQEYRKQRKEILSRAILEGRKRTTG